STGQLAGRVATYRFRPARGGTRASSRAESGSKLPHSKATLNIPGINLELVLDMHAIDLHLHNLLVKRSWGAALEPARRAPGIKRGLAHDPVMDCVPVDITQPGEVGLQVGQASFPVLEPHLAPAGSIPAVCLDRGQRVQMSAERGKRSSLRGRQSDEMVVIGVDRPGLQLPLVLFRQLEKLVAEVLEALGAGESGLLEVCASGHDVSSGLRQAVNRAVRPIAHRSLRDS